MVAQRIGMKEQREPRSAAEAAQMIREEEYRTKVEARARDLFCDFDPEASDTTGYKLIVQLKDGRPTQRAKIFKPAPDGQELTAACGGPYNIDLVEKTCDCIHFTGQDGEAETMDMQGQVLSPGKKPTEGYGYCKHSLAVAYWQAHYRVELTSSKNGKFAFVSFLPKRPEDY